MKTLFFDQANVEPIRLQQIIPTFPYFQLSRFNNVIEDLGLSHSSYLDTYIPSSNQWEQHTISSVRIVDRQQRLLYKVRQSLVEGLSEAECCSLHEELELQHRGGGGGGARFHPSSSTSSSSNDTTQSPLRSTSAPSANNNVSPLPKAMLNEAKGFLKRPDAPRGEEQDESTRHSPKVHVTDGYYMSHSGSSTMVSSPVTLTGPGSSTASTPTTVANSQSSPQPPQDNNVYIYPYHYGGAQSTQAAPDSTHNALPDYLIAPPAPAPPIPYHPHPPLKRWPNDYTVCELSQGFHSMDLLIASSPSGASMTQRMAFERVFGSRYVKSTVCRHRAVWRKAPRALREQFELMGSDDRACWGEFVRRVENRPSAKNQNSVDLMATPTGGGNMGGYHDQQSPPEVEEAHGAEVHGAEVIGSMQTRGWWFFILVFISGLNG